MTSTGSARTAPRRAIGWPSAARTRKLGGAIGCKRLGERRGEGQPADEDDESQRHEPQHIFRAGADDAGDPLLPPSMAIEQGSDDRRPIGFEILDADRNRANVLIGAVQIVGADRRLDAFPRRRIVAMGDAHVGGELRHGGASHLVRFVQRLFEPRPVLFGQGAPGFGCRAGIERRTARQTGYPSRPGATCSTPTPDSASPFGHGPPVIKASAIAAMAGAVWKP